MIDYNTSVGQALRRLRLHRGRTLKQAAAELNISAPTLSRKERGLESIERLDIRLAVGSYKLTPHEAAELWLCAGLQYEPQQLVLADDVLNELAHSLLFNISSPAFILDLPGYVRAWNQGIEALWSPSQSNADKVHMVDDFFSDRMRKQLGKLWESYVARAIKVFYQRVRFFTNTPEVKSVLSELERKHGVAFTKHWRKLEDEGLMHLESESSPSSKPDMLVRYESSVGLIMFLTSQVMSLSPAVYDLVIYTPFGHESTARASALHLLNQPSAVYMRPNAQQHGNYDHVHVIRTAVD